MPNLALKEQKVGELSEQISRAKLTVLADYRGLSVAELTTFRRRLREANGEFHIAKNTLTRRAAEQQGCAELVPYLEGPTGLAFAYGDEAALAKAINEYARTSRILTVKAGLLGNQVLQPAEVTRLADLPSREVMLARVVGGIQAPIAGLVNVLSGTLSGFVRVLDARRQQLEGGQ